MADSPERSPPVPPRRFRDAALASGLVAAADLDAAEAEVMRRMGATGLTPEQFDKAVAGVLVEQGKLAPFQAREMLAGRTRFRLGQYTVIDEIGRGGMGQVFKAEHALMGRHVAVKVLPRAKATPESEAAFRREMRILGRLDHENLVRAFDAGYDAKVYYLVTELVPGLDLRRQVRKYGRLDEVSAASVFTQVARALAFAHGERLVHRDVKPGNILVMDDGRVKLLDLGLAGSTLEAEALRLGRVVGTMDYIAPEQIRRPDSVGPSADIYALGCTMYFALTGEVPFPGGTPKDKMRRHLAETPVPIGRLVPQVSQPMCQVVESMMAKSVADRIGSADEVIGRLARWTSEKPVALPRRRPARGGTAGSAAGGSESTGSDSVGSSVTAGSAEAPWPLEDWVPGDEARRPLSGVGLQSPTPARVAGESFGNIAFTAAKILVPATIGGAGVAILMSLVWAVDAERVGQLLGPLTPTACGWWAFLLVAAVQGAVAIRSSSPLKAAGR